MAKKLKKKKKAKVKGAKEAKKTDNILLELDKEIEPSLAEHPNEPDLLDAAKDLQAIDSKVET